MNCQKPTTCSTLDVNVPMTLGVATLASSLLLTWSFFRLSKDYER
jgi:hypothetical protein